MLTQQRTHLDWDEMYVQHGAALTKFEELIDSYERERKLELSPGAIEVLLVPLVEILEAGKEIDYDEVAGTLEEVMNELAVTRDERDKKRSRSSLSMLQAFARRWCDIPPICGPTEDVEE